MRTSNSRFKKLTIVLSGALLVAGAVSVTPSFADPGGQQKYFVCKYVGTPGADERLQTGQNPISVAATAIDEDPVVVGSYFNDAQGRSFVLMEDTTPPGPEGDPDVSACPGYVAPQIVAPDYRVTAAGCNQAGSLVITSVEGITSTPEPGAYGPGTYDLVFAAEDGYAFAGGLMTLTVDDVEVDPGIPYQSTDPTGVCYQADASESVSPVPPEASPADCEVDGELVISEQPDGVAVSQSPEGTEPGVYEIVFSPEPGFVFPAGTSTTYTVQVDEGIEYQSDDPAGLCYRARGGGGDDIAGVEATRPKAAPQAAAAVEVEVLGVEAEAPTPPPTAVSAGLGEAPAGSPLGSGMVAGGLGLLALAGIMAKRRPVLDESRR